VVALNKSATLGSVRMLMIEYTPKVIDSIPRLETPAVVTREPEAKPQEIKKEEKQKRNIWADMKSKFDTNDDAPDESAIKTFKYP
jgi:hypothetical protein